MTRFGMSMLAAMLVAACGTADDPIDCIALGDDTLCLDGRADDSLACEQVDTNTFLCGNQQVSPGFGATDLTTHSQSSIRWRGRWVEGVPEHTVRSCNPAGHACVVCATCGAVVNACLDCAAQWRNPQADDVEPSPDPARGE